MEFTSGKLTDYALDLSIEEVSDAAIAAAERLVLDSLGCCLGAYTSPPSKYLRALYGDIGDASDETATVFGSGTTTLVEYAAFINSTLVRYLDFNDAYISEGRACHPSDHIPALISIAESEGRSGSDLIEAIILAYEIEGMGLDTGVTWEFGYDYVTWGAFSSVASVGKLMGLSRRELISALGIVGSSNLSLGIARRGEVSMWKGLAHPYVTHNAVQACQMAEAGVTGPEHVFEGPDGFWEVAARSELTADEVGGRNGAEFRITKSNIKPFPCGYYMMPILSSVLDIVDTHEIDPSDIGRVRIETFANAVDVLAGDEKWSTDLTRESADHSIPYATAIAIRHGSVMPKHFGEKYRTDERVHRLMDRVEVVESEEMNEFARTHPNSTPSIVRISTDDDEFLSKTEYAPGHAKNPLSDREVEWKMRNMAEPLISAEQIDQLIRTCDELRDRASVDPLLEGMSI